MDALENALKKFDPESALAIAGLLLKVRTVAAGAPAIKDLIDYPQEVIENFYAIAADFYGRGQFEDAKPVFQHLMQLDLTNAIYPLALGACEQAAKKYHEAIAYYALASFNAPKDPTAYYYLAECALLMNQKAAAHYFYEQVIRIADENKAYQTLKERAEKGVLQGS